MRITFPASLLILLLLFNACGKSQEETGNSKSAEDSTSEQSTIKADTMPEIEPPEPGLPPGTIRLKAEVLKIENVKDEPAIVYDIKALQTLGIGSSTPPVATGDTLRFISSKKSTKLTEGEEITCTLKHQQVLEKFKDTTPSWQLQQLN